MTWFVKIVEFLEPIYKGTFRDDMPTDFRYLSSSCDCVHDISKIPLKSVGNPSEQIFQFLLHKSLSTES